MRLAYAKLAVGQFGFLERNGRTVFQRIGY